MTDREVSDHAGQSHSRDPNSTDQLDFYIVGVGASAGGFEALEEMFQAVPADTGMAFVIVQHLSPDLKA